MYSRIINRQMSVYTRAFLFAAIMLVIVSLPVSTVFAFTTPYSYPTSASSPGKSWSNISYSFLSDNLYATSKRANKQLKLSNFSIPGIPGGATIDGIEVSVEGFTNGLQVNVSLSYNSGSSYTNTYTTNLTNSETVNILGGPTNTWGRNWTAGEFTNSNFIVKLTTTGSGFPISVDQVRVRVYYTPPSTSLNVSPVSGSYGGTTSMSAILTQTSTSMPISSKTINFYIGGSGIDGTGNCTGTYAGNATTDASGTATLLNASLNGINAGTYPYGACASFAGDLSYQATSMTSSLQVNGTSTELAVDPVSSVYGGTVSLSATLTSNGTPVKGEWITFYLFGNSVGSSKTDNSGIASLGNVSLIGYNANSSNDIGASFEGNADLDPSNSSGLITIDPRLITVTAVSSTKVYDGTTNSNGIPQITTGSLVTGDVAAFTQAFSNKDVGSGKTITPTGTVEDDNFGQNYNTTFVPVNSGVINKALLIVTADNKTKIIGQTDPVFTFQYNGLVGGDTSAVIDISPTCSVSVVHNIAGTYPIICSGGSDNNYNFSYVNGTLIVSAVTFADVPSTYWAWDYIERLYRAGITGGCTTSPLNYCPGNSVTRAQMAVFLEKGLHYPSTFTAPNVAPTFNDTAGHWAEDWIEALKSDGITAGCATGLYCPENPVTRAQMAVFLLKSKYGSAYTPPAVGASTGFTDVPTTHWAAAWIKQLAAEGITGGCGSDTYCPDNPVTRAQMAVFLVKTFVLP